MTTRLPEDQDAAIQATYKKIHADINREKRSFQSLLTCCAILGLLGMGAVALCTHVTAIDPIGFVIGALFIACVAFMCLSD